MNRVTATTLMLLVASPSFNVRSAADGEAEVWFSSEKAPAAWDAWGQVETRPAIEFKLAPQPSVPFRTTPGEGPTIRIDPSVTYQTLLGFGTSLEETTVANLLRLTAANRTAVLRVLFHPTDGIGMNLVRICIGTSDFTGRPWYSYCDTKDPTLSKFSIQKDIDYGIIGVLKEAKAQNPDLQFFASPWSPPGWMKDSGTMCGGRLLPEYYPIAARYYRMFLQAYAREGIPIVAMTVNNEVGVSRRDMPSTRFRWREEAAFLKVLVTELRRSDVTTAVWILDHNFDMAQRHAGRILADPEAYAVTGGIAFHDYEGEPAMMATLHDRYPDKPAYVTEQSVWGVAGAHRIVEYLRHWACSHNAWVTVADNDEKWHGPNRGPFNPDPTLFVCDAQDANRYWPIPELYLSGQFSKFIQRGAKRVFSDPGHPRTVTNVVLLNPDRTLVAVVVNQTPSAQRFTLQTPGNGCIVATLPPKTMGTYRWQTAPSDAGGVR